MWLLPALIVGTSVLLSPGCHFPQVETAQAGRVVGTSPDALAEALRDLLSDPARLRAMGERGRDYVARHYSWDAIVTQLEDVYGEGVERYRR